MIFPRPFRARGTRRKDVNKHRRLGEKCGANLQKKLYIGETKKIDEGSKKGEIIGGG